jgi:CYTH domain-containing protein
MAELERVAVPSWVRSEVTDDPRYSAIALAALPGSTSATA